MSRSRPLLFGSLVLACAPAQSNTAVPEPPTPPANPLAAAQDVPRIPGPCSMHNEAFAGVTDVVYSYEDGKRVRAVEMGPDGQRQVLWSYDPQGRRSQEVRIDGTEIETRTFHYDRELLVREDVRRGDDPQVQVQQRRTYDAAGVLRDRSEARWVDGAFVVVDHHALHYDDTGRFVYELRTLTPLDGPQAVHSITVDVDEQGRVIARRVDEGMDGTFERVSLYDFDDAGRLHTVTTMDASAIVDVARHGYDADGNLVRTDLEDGEGKPLGFSTYDFSCWD